MPWMNTDTSDSTLPRLMSAPPCCLRYLMALSKLLTTPHKLMSDSYLKSLGLPYSSLPHMPTPTLLTHISKPLKLARAASAMRRTAAGPATVATLPPIY